MSKPRPISAKPLSVLLSDVFSDAYAKQGFAARELVTRWAEIAGSEVAAHSQPLKIQWPRPVEGQPQEPATQPGPERLSRAAPPGELDHPVLAGYDGSRSSRHALAYAAGMARRLGRPLVLVYVCPGVYCAETSFVVHGRGRSSTMPVSTAAVDGDGVVSNSHNCPAAAA